MMADVKGRLLERLEGIEDEYFLSNILYLVENVADNGVYHFSADQKADIDESINQISKGEFKTHEQVMKRYLR